MRKSLFVFLCYLLPVTATMAQTEVASFRPGVTLDGVNYFLPKTLLRVTIVSDKAVTTPGEYASYADRYLRQPSVPTATSVEWNIKSVSVDALVQYQAESQDISAARAIDRRWSFA